MPEKQVINGFWINGPLTNIQRLSIQSFLDHGHDYVLWSDRHWENVPKGATVRDFEEIIPAKDRERFKNDANFSDWFRTNLLLAKGGWYADTDIVCLKPFDFVCDRVFVSEYQFGEVEPENTKPLVNGCIAKIPAGDRMLLSIKSRIEKLDTKNCGWCDVGPNQFRFGVAYFNYTGFVQRPDIFDGLWPTDLNRFVSESDWEPRSGAYTLHLRTSYWGRGTLQSNGKFPAGSWFEYLKRRHQIGQ